MLMAPTLRAQAKERKMMAAGTAGLAEGHRPHVRDAVDVLKSAWDSVTEETTARCWVKTQSTAAGDGGYALGSARKSRARRSNDPSVEGLAKTRNNVSSRVRQADERGSPVTDTELVDLLANLNIIPGECADKAAIEAAQVWATVEDQEDVVEDMRLDAVNEMTGQLEGTDVGGVDSTDDDEKEDGVNERTGCGDTVPPPYSEISSSIGLLEKAAEEGGNGNAAFHLQKARMAFIEAHASNPVLQADKSFSF